MKRLRGSFANMVRKHSLKSKKDKSNWLLANLLLFLTKREKRPSRRSTSKDKYDLSAGSMLSLEPSPLRFSLDLGSLLLLNP